MGTYKKASLDVVEVSHRTKLVTSEFETSVDRFIDYFLKDDTTKLENQGIYYFSTAERNESSSSNCPQFITSMARSSNGSKTLESDSLVFYSPLIDRHKSIFFGPWSNMCPAS